MKRYGEKGLSDFCLRDSVLFLKTPLPHAPALSLGGALPAIIIDQGPRSAALHVIGPTDLAYILSAFLVTRELDPSPSIFYDES